MFYEFFFYQGKENEGRLSYVYPCVSLINQVFVICSFTILRRLTQLCFTWVILDLGDSRKWIIPSLNRLVHWKTGFQNLHSYFSVNFDKWSRAPFLQNTSRRLLLDIFIHTFNHFRHHWTSSQKNNRCFNWF